MFSEKKKNFSEKDLEMCYWRGIMVDCIIWQKINSVKINMLRFLE